MAQFLKVPSSNYLAAEAIEKRLPL